MDAVSSSEMSVNLSQIHFSTFRFVTTPLNNFYEILFQGTDISTLVTLNRFIARM
jgi:hypothetical protein